MRLKAPQRTKDIMSNVRKKIPRFRKKQIAAENITTSKTFRERWNTIWSDVKYYLSGLLSHFIKDDGLFLASGMSFAVVTCIIPLMLLLTSILGSILESRIVVYQQIDEILGKIFVAKPYVGTIRETLTSIIEEIISNRTGFGFVAAFTLIWTSTNLFAFTRSSLHRIYRVTQTKNIIMSILEDITWVLAAAVLFFIVNGVMWMYSFLVSLLTILLGTVQVQKQLLEYSVPFIMSFLSFVALFFIIYRYIPDQRIPKKIALISSLMTAILWQSAGELFSWYLSRFPAFGKIYGAYAFLIVALLWIYYSCITFVIGGQIGQLYREKHEIELGEK
jgi:membrane protein